MGVPTTVKRVVLPAAIAVLVAGCGHNHASTMDAFRAHDRQSLTFIVRNQHVDEARIWLWLNGRRERLGSVLPHDTDQFRVPLDRLAEARLEVDLLVGTRCMTPTVMLEPGIQVDFTIPPDLDELAARCR